MLLRIAWGLFALALLIVLLTVLGVINEHHYCFNDCYNRGCHRDCCYDNAVALKGSTLRARDSGREAASRGFKGKGYDKRRQLLLASQLTSSAN